MAAFSCMARNLTMKLGAKVLLVSLLGMIGYGLYTRSAGAGGLLPSGAAPKPPYIPTQRLTARNAIELADYLDQVEFGGWFARNYSIKDVVAMWQVESGLDPRAIGDNGKAYGLGQVWARSAREVGFNDVAALLTPEAGALASMRYLKLVHRWMTTDSRGTQSPNFEDLIWAYNAGIGNFFQRRMPAHTRDTHLPRWRRARVAL